MEMLDTSMNMGYDIQLEENNIHQGRMTFN